jgi:hypothetical protein
VVVPPTSVAIQWLTWVFVIGVEPTWATTCPELGPRLGMAEEEGSALLEAPAPSEPGAGRAAPAPAGGQRESQRAGQRN